jgi:hypothetical protein
MGIAPTVFESWTPVDAVQICQIQLNMLAVVLGFDDRTPTVRCVGRQGHQSNR